MQSQLVCSIGRGNLGNARKKTFFFRMASLSFYLSNKTATKDFNNSPVPETYFIPTHKLGECWDLVWFQLWELGCGCQHQPWCKPVAERPLDFIASDFCFKTLQWPSPGNLSKFSSGRCGGGEGGRSTKSSFQPSKGNFQLPYKICFSFAHRGILVSKIIACGNRKWKKTFLEGIQCKTTWRLKFFSFLALKVLSGNWFFSDSSEINGVASYSWLEQINRDS